ncbi:Spy/CpxP family protein refolding chaperone [Methylocystis parvus]|uniref:Spy/CpxP family protein refolding chaperone n=1 Tax=Methylocystis parvus TaxID=134 RepID=UPI003C715378
MIARAIFTTTSIAALALASSLVLARAEPAPEMDHSKMDHSKMDHSAHGAGAAQWADPGKAQSAPAAEAAKPDAPSAAPKADEHAGHHGGGSGGDMGGMMGGMMGGGMNHGGSGGGGMGGMSHGGDKGGGMGGMMQHMMCGFTEHLEGRLAYLKAELKLTDQQTSAWNNFADAWRAAAQKAQAKCGATEERVDHAKPPVLSKLDMMEKHMTDHLDIVRAQKAAIEPLFTALSDEQKKIASETMTHFMKVGMSMGGGGMGGMGGMMGGMGGMSHGGSGGMQH